MAGYFGNTKRALKLMRTCDVTRLTPQEAQEFYGIWRRVEESDYANRDQVERLEVIVRRAGTWLFS